MLSLQTLADIAARHLTAMAEAMLIACVAKSLETGEVVRIPDRACPPMVHEARPAEGVDWEAMVTRTSDTRWQHV